MADRYTKAILTVIAVCLVVIASRDAGNFGTANAQSGPVRVVLESVDQFAFQFVTLNVRQR